MHALSLIVKSNSSSAGFCCVLPCIHSVHGICYEGRWNRTNGLPFRVKSVKIAVVAYCYNSTVVRSKTYGPKQIIHVTIRPTTL